MAFGKIDLNDAIVSPFFVIASGVQADLLTFAPFGFDFSESIITLGSGPEAVTITAARIIAVAAILVALASNKPDFSKMGGVQLLVTFSTIGLVMAPPFTPLLASIITGSTIAGLLAVIVQSGGFYSLSYLG